LRLSAGKAVDQLSESLLNGGRSLLPGNGKRRFEIDGDQLQDEQRLYWTQRAHNIDTWQPLAGAIAASLYTREIGEQVGPSQVSVVSRAQLGADYSPCPESAIFAYSTAKSCLSTVVLPMTEQLLHFLIKTNRPRHCRCTPHPYHSLGLGLEYLTWEVAETG